MTHDANTRAADARPDASTLLRTAADLVGGSRNVTHGEKERSFAAIAGLWEAYLKARRDPAAPISPADVPAMMTLLKFARSEHGQHIEDHGVDAAGYAAIWGELRS